MMARMGSALILIGLVAMVVFLVTFSAGRGQFEVLLAGAGTSALGLLLRRRRAEEIKSGRFRTLRRLMGSDEDSDEGE